MKEKPPQNALTVKPPEDSEPAADADPELHAELDALERLFRRHAQFGPAGDARELWYWRGRLVGLLRAEANRRALEAFHELRAELRTERLEQLVPEAPKGWPWS